MSQLTVLGCSSISEVSKRVLWASFASRDNVSSWDFITSAVCDKISRVMIRDQERRSRTLPSTSNCLLCNLSGALLWLCKIEKGLEGPDDGKGV